MSQDKQNDIPETNEYEEPRIFRVAEIKGVNDVARRKFLSNAVKAVAGAGALASLGCDSKFDVKLNSKGECGCHVVCSCDMVSSSKSEMDSQYNGGVCTCDLVCTCNTVKTGGGGGGGYYYTYYV